MYKVLMVDDDRVILEINRRYFTEQGYAVLCAQSAELALETIRTAQLDCVVLDIDLPDHDGFEVCSRVREISSLPIVFLSGYTEEQSRVRGLIVGGDDYVCKPYSLQELELRVRIRIQRRKGDEPVQVLHFSGLTIDTARRVVSYEGQEGNFSSLEFDILAFLARHPGQVFSYEQLYDRVWNTPINESLHNLQVRVARVRQQLAALCPDHEFIQTVRRKGYRFMP